MPWMCLERCGGNTSTINANIAQIASNTTLFNAVAFEGHNLGPNGSFPGPTEQNLTNVAQPLHALGVQTYAMISSYPYPKEFIDWMRFVFANPDPFIAKVVAAVQSLQLSGVNIDWEPVQSTDYPITAADAVAYASFLSKITTALRPYNARVSVDIATWSPLWNMTLLAESEVDSFCLMSTYTDDWKAFQDVLHEAVTTIGVDRLVVGLETIQPSNKQPYSKAQLEERFKLITQYGVKSIGVWKSPVPDLWLPFLTQWES